MIPKFRVWDKTINEMISWRRLLNGYNLRNVFMRPEMCGLILMQSTGLFDKNGVEIFDGDILSGHCVYPEYNIFESKLIGEVYYSNRGTWDCYSYILGGFNEQIEVIGNIYENPELLEVTDD